MRPMKEACALSLEREVFKTCQKKTCIYMKNRLVEEVYSFCRVCKDVEHIAAHMSKEAYIYIKRDLYTYGQRPR